jgi:predicted permease
MLSRDALPFTSHSISGHLTFPIDARVCLTSITLMVVSALLFGLAPARQVVRSDPLQAMKGGSEGTATFRRFSARDLWLGLQIAICMLLVTASLVAVRGMVRMLHTPLGFQPQGVMLADIDLSKIKPADDLAREKAMIAAVRNIPGVAAAAAVNRVPFTGGLRGVPVFLPGTTDFRLNNSVLAPYVFVITPGYLDAARTRLLSGRDVSWHDTAATPDVAIVNQIFARRMWGDGLALGQRFILKDHLREVVGVVETGKYHSMQEAPQPVVYLPYAQEPSEGLFVVRSSRAATELAAALERTLGAFEPDAPIEVQSWPDAMGGQLLPSRAATVALGVMGLLGAMLALTGIFGMAVYNVSRRMKELGIRVALGARARHVLRAAVGRPILLLGCGSLCGLLLAVFASRLLGAIVYQANPRDPIVVIGAVVTMSLLGLAASAIPALRALAVDPSKLLRSE